MPRLRKVSCIREYSPLRRDLAALQRLLVRRQASGRRASRRRRPWRLAELATTSATSSATWPRSRPWTPIVRSIVGWRLVWVTSAGTLARRTVATFRSGIGFFCVGLGDRDVEQRLDRLDVLLGILHADEVLVLADRVDPEVLLVELDAGVERGDDVPHHVRLGQPQVGRLGLVDLDDVLRVVEPLDDPGVDHAVDVA